METLLHTLNVFLNIFHPLIIFLKNVYSIQVSSKPSNVTVVAEHFSVTNPPTSGPLATRAARRARNNRRSTGPIAQDDVNLAAGDSVTTTTPPNEIDERGNDMPTKNGLALKKGDNDDAELFKKLMSKDDPHRFVSKPVFAYMVSFIDFSGLFYFLRLPAPYYIS